MQWSRCLLGLVLGLRLLAQDSSDPAAWELYERGRDAEKAGHMAEAYLFYAQAAAKDPHNKTYWDRTQSVQSRAAGKPSRSPRFPR